MQNEYNISYDKFNEAYLCEIEDKTISSDFLVDLLLHIAKQYSYVVWHVMNIEEYKESLEDDLNIKINYLFDEELIL